MIRFDHRFFASSVAIALLAGCAASTPAEPVGTSTKPRQVMATSAEHEAPRDPGDPRDPRAGGPKDHGPPPPAYEACATKSEGDACTLSFGDKAKAGKCTKPPTTAADARAFCLPEAVGGAAAAKGASNDRP